MGYKVLESLFQPKGFYNSMMSYFNFHKHFQAVWLFRVLVWLGFFCLLMFLQLIYCTLKRNKTNVLLIIFSVWCYTTAKLQPDFSLKEIKYIHYKINRILLIKRFYFSLIIGVLFIKKSPNSFHVIHKTFPVLFSILLSSPLAAL